MKTNDLENNLIEGYQRISYPEHSYQNSENDITSCHHDVIVEAF